MNVFHARITTHTFSHIGQRDQNQDRVAVLESPHDGARLLVVADGLGGHTGGSLAAETVVSAAERCWRDHCTKTAEYSPQAGTDSQPESPQSSASSGQSPETFLKFLVRVCHEAVRRAGRAQGLDPHSTIAALLYQDGQAFSVHAGDSRVMQYSERSFVDRTLDHSVAQLHALRGTIADDEIAEHPDQNKLFAQLGGPAAPEAEIKRWDLSQGRRFVLCSDGFWEIFRHEEILETFVSDDPETELKDRFERKLRQLENHDNTTAILTAVAAADARPDELPAADETPASVPAPRDQHRRGSARLSRSSASAAALLMLLQPAGIAVAQGEGGERPESGQVEVAPVSQTQAESQGVPSGEAATESGDNADGNAEPDRVPDRREASSPIQLQSSVITPDRPIEPGEVIAEAVADELRQRGRLGVNDSLASVNGSRELGEATVLRMRQEHRGIPVFAAEVIVSSLGDRIVRIAGDSTPEIRLDSTVPVYDYASAIALAQTLTGMIIAPQNDGALVVFPSDGGGRLAWSGPALVASSPEPAAGDIAETSVAQSLEHVYIDAANGEVLLRLPLAHQALDRRIHDFSQACRDARNRRPVNMRSAMARALTLIQSSPLVRSEAVGGWHRNAERLFDAFGAYYGFLRLTLDIDSIDDAGKPLVGYIGARFDERVPNIPQCIGDEFMAFWIPSNGMILTDAVLDFPELIGHEATHGLVGHGSGLIYQNESGALHESIADSLGVAFRGWRDDGERPDMAAEVAMGAPKWQIREPSGVLRDLQSPGSVTLPDGTPLPDHYDDYMYLPVDIDNGGVHVNSSIMNHGFYLLAEGGRHTRLRHGPEVEGIGVMHAARLFGAAGSWLLAPASGFEDARHAFAHAAEAIHGENSAEWVAVHTAMDAIGIPGVWERPPEPMAEPEPPATAPFSRTLPAPRSPPSPPITTTPQSPPAQETAAEPAAPAPDPMAEPSQVQTPAQEPASEQDESRIGGTVPGHPLVLVLVAALALAGSAFVAYTYRPGRSSPTRWKPENHQTRNLPVTPPVRESLGTLTPEDGTAEISLPRELLASPEGLVIGCSASICHIHLRDSVVSRRHCRLRLADETVVVEDLNSVAGVRLDGVVLSPFKPQPLFSGQSLSVAGMVYSIDIGAKRS